MSQSTFVDKVTMLNAVSLGADIAAGAIDGPSTNPVNISDATLFAIQLAWTGTPTGTFTLQGSVDEVNWDTITTVSAAGAAASATTNVERAAYTYVRVIYTRVSGTGTVTATISMKRD